MFSLFPRYYGHQQSIDKGSAGLVTSTVLHVLVGALAVLGFIHRDEIEELARPIAVSLIEAGQHSKPVPPPPKRKVEPLPIATSVATDSSSAPSGAMAPAPAAPAGPTVTEARFDADYLSNPKPPYPSASRRLGESGTVYLRVQVSAEGHAMHVDIKKSSGFERLDQSAQNTVAQWRFVPARRGGEAVSSWVVVPVIFSLT